MSKLEPEHILNDYAEARMAANKMLAQLGVIDDDGYADYKVLITLLGKVPDELLRHNFTEDDYKTCLLLAGPHSYTIYKMLCLKHGLTGCHNDQK